MAKVITNLPRDEREIVLDAPKQIITQTCTPSVQCTPPQPPVRLTETRPKITHIKRRRRVTTPTPPPPPETPEFIWWNMHTTGIPS